MYTHLDDAGKLEHHDNTIVITGKSDLLNKSFDNYKKLMSLQDEHSKKFQRYLPHRIEKLSNEELKITCYENAVSLRQVFEQFNGKVDQPHVNWILSRVLELATWLSQIKVVHCGLNLDSLYVIPRNHGLMCMSFYHMTVVDSKLTTISGRNINLYPAYNLVKKVATSSIDNVCAKKIALYLMGDKSTLGDMFLNDVHYNEHIINYLQKTDDVMLDSYKEYRDILKRFYNTKQFHELKIENDETT